jgi:hypothetical protein
VGPRAGLDTVQRRKFLLLPGLEFRTLRGPARSQYSGSSVTGLSLVRLVGKVQAKLPDSPWTRRCWFIGTGETGGHGGGRPVTEREDRTCSIQYSLLVRRIGSYLIQLCWLHAICASRHHNTECL